MKTLAGFSLVMVVVLVSLSAYLRLAHSGIGCSDWPHCYGRIGVPETALAPAANQSATVSGTAYQRLLQRSGDSLAWGPQRHDAGQQDCETGHDGADAVGAVYRDPFGAANGLSGGGHFVVT